MNTNIMVKLVVYHLIGKTGWLKVAVNRKDQNP